MNKLTIAAALAAATMLATPAQAADPEGKIQVKVLATGVLPDGKIESVNVNLTAAPTAAQLALLAELDPHNLRASQLKDNPLGVR